MKLSLITPTHDPKFLSDSYASIQAQQHYDLEWVICPNNCPVDAPGLEKLREISKRDSRVRIVPAEVSTTNIGELKRFACSVAKGDAFVELDHDDLLMPDILADVAKAFEDGAGFVYSDVAVFEEDNASWGYAPRMGWESYPVEAYARKFIASRCLPLSPRMLCEVHYAPDHIRAWSRKAYYGAGGHNPAMSVADDHDLICRTYLEHFKFTYLNKCGYLYRWHRGNTVKARNAAIQAQQAANRSAYLLPLVAEWCRRENLASCDVLKAWKENRWSPERSISELLKDGPYGQITASDVLQFVPSQLHVGFFNAAYNALAPGGFLHVTVPSERGRYASQNPLHLVRFNKNSFLYYTQPEFAANMPGVKCRFDLVTNEEIYPNDDFKRYDMLIVRADMSALKGQRHPGKSPDVWTNSERATNGNPG